MGLLEKIQTPEDVRRLPEHALPQLCRELREAMVAACTPVGGHLGGSLGAVELVVALHRALDTPRDLLVIDTGHQAYAHKLLTGRAELMRALRQEHGAAGFLERHESAFDAWGAGHASTGISAALGLAEASARRGENRRVAVLVGDGALTGGLALEALNNVGARRVLIVLNDNGMSIAKNVGAIASMLAKTSSNPTESIRRLADSIGAAIREGRRPHLESLAPGPRAFFEALGLNYLGPIDGHDTRAISEALERAKAIDGPVLIHARTQKGHGFALAEADVETRGHAMGPFDAEGKPLKKSASPSFTDVFADGLAQLMERDERIVAITAAMPDGTGLARVARRFPERVFDVGIAEAHAVTFAAGLAAGGLRPVVAIYSTFMQRALDQVIHDVALQNLPVTFAIDRAGLVGGDGATHQGAFDVAFLRAVPNLVFAAPSDENELRNALAAALAHEGPFALRFPRGSGPGAKIDPVPQPMAIGRSRLFLRTAVRAEVTLLALGPAVHACAQAARALANEKIHASVIDARFIKPLDVDAIRDAASLGPMVTVEHAALAGGFGSAVLELLESLGIRANVKRLGLPESFVPHGDPSKQLGQLGLDADGIARAVREILGRAGAHAREGA